MRVVVRGRGDVLRVETEPVRAGNGGVGGGLRGGGSLRRLRRVGLTAGSTFLTRRPGVPPGGAGADRPRRGGSRDGARGSRRGRESPTRGGGGGGGRIVVVVLSSEGSKVGGHDGGIVVVLVETRPRPHASILGLVIGHRHTPGSALRLRSVKFAIPVSGGAE